MKSFLVSAFCAFVLFAGFALAQSAPAKAADPPAPALQLTDLQKARLDVARQKILRWQDRMEQALGEFNDLCQAAQHENKWPEVRCSLSDLSVQSVAQPMPAPAAAASPSPPEVKKQ